MRSALSFLPFLTANRKWLIWQWAEFPLLCIFWLIPYKSFVQFCRDRVHQTNCKIMSLQEEKICLGKKLTYSEGPHWIYSNEMRKWGPGWLNLPEKGKTCCSRSVFNCHLSALTMGRAISPFLHMFSINTAPRSIWPRPRSYTRGPRSLMGTRLTPAPSQSQWAWLPVQSPHQAGRPHIL